ncbi:hypothetical protein D3C87_1849560 [compost metagenome]
MSKQQPPATNAHHFGGGEIIAMTQALNFTACLTRIGRPGGQRQRQRAIHQSGAKHGDKRKGEDQARHRHHHVGKAH